MVVVSFLMHRMLIPTCHRGFVNNVGLSRWKLISSASSFSSMSIPPTSSLSRLSLRQRLQAIQLKMPSRSASTFQQRRKFSLSTESQLDEEQKQKKHRRRWVKFSILVANLFGFFLYSQFRDADVLIDRDSDAVAVPIGFWHKCMMALPWRYLSRGWGYIHSMELPVFMRPVVIGAYARLTGCDLNEAADSDYKHYRNIGEFFRRSLKPGLRPIDDVASLVSPADGRVVACSRVCNDRIDEVKGITYSMAKFLGPRTWDCGVAEQSGSHAHNYGKELLRRCDEHDLYECVIYLAPGDYHRFHSPASWSIQHRRHFPGDLLSVHPSVAAWFPNLFAINERAAYYGEWEHGFFAVGIVGATNVGTIKVPFDSELATNKRKFKRNSWIDLKFDKPVKQDKGAYFGEFNMGSTLVLIFEAPKNSQFTVGIGDRVRVGERLIEVSA